MSHKRLRKDLIFIITQFRNSSFLRFPPFLLFSLLYFLFSFQRIFLLPLFLLPLNDFKIKTSFRFSSEPKITNVKNHRQTPLMQSKKGSTNVFILLFQVSSFYVQSTFASRKIFSKLFFPFPLTEIFKWNQMSKPTNAFPSNQP